MSAVDYSFTKPTIAQLVAAGIKYVGRYVGPPSWGKTITQTEYDSLVAAGIEPWLVFEVGANDAAGGFGAGQVNGRTALAYVPQGYTGPIWVAADEEIVPGTSLWTSALAYVQGFSSVVGAERTGVYGEGALCQACIDSGTALVGGWQSASTSFPGNSTTLPSTWIQQGLSGPLPGTDADTILHPLFPAPAPPTPTEAPMAVSPVIPFTGSNHAFQVSDNILWHKWNVGGPGVQNENVAQAAGVPPTFPDQTPQVAIIGNQLTVAVQDVNLRFWYFAGTPGGPDNALKWGSQQVP